MKIAQKSFRRVSPAKFADRVELPVGWMVLRHDHLATKDARRATHGHWAALISGKNKIYRVVRYSVNLPKEQIVLDWAGWIDLQGRIASAPDEIVIRIRSPHPWEYPFIPFGHVDPGYRMSAWLGAISIALGTLSVLISLCGS